MGIPTLINTRVRSTRDARLIFHAVVNNELPLITRRLTSEERRTYIRSGSVFVWEERGLTSESTGVGIERWTDGKHWGPSRVRDEFLFYYEQPRESQKTSQGVDRLIKQTFSVYVNRQCETRKWHLVAYFTHTSVDRLATIDGLLDTTWLVDPEEEYRSARTTKGRPRGEHLLYEQGSDRGFPTKQGHDVDSYRYPFEDRSSLTPPRQMLPLPPVPPRPGESALELAPLVYLQNVSGPPRAPLDDFAIRALDSIL